MTEYSIILTGTADWHIPFTDALNGAFPVHTLTEPNHYYEQLVTHHAALILVDADAPNWDYWSSTAKSSPATRRIPVIVVTDNPAIQQAARFKGADLTRTPAQVIADPLRLIETYATIPDDGFLDALACGCEKPLPPEALSGIEKFNSGEYYAQHDLFEALWMKTEGPERELYRAILQVGIAYYQIERGNHRGAVKMLQRSVQWLALLPDVCQGVDVAQLRADSQQVRAALMALDPAEIAHFDRNLLKPVRRVP